MTVQEMRSARDTHTAIFLKYLNKVNKVRLFCFFEGQEDRYYYVNEINLILNEKFIWLGCDGKSNLSKALVLIEKDKETNKRNIQLMFFMDGDFNNKEEFAELLTNYSTDLYILEAYSFENFYCTKECFEKILEREFGVENLSDDMLEFTQDYQNLIDKTKNFYETLNNSFYIIRQIRKIDYRSLNFNEMNIVSYQQDTKSIEINNSLSYESIANHYGLPHFNETEIRQAEEFFKDKELERYGRGHNQIKLLICYLRCFYKNNKDGNLKVKGKTVRYSCKTDVSFDLIEHCSYAAEKPQDLICFIRRHKPV